MWEEVFFKSLKLCICLSVAGFLKIAGSDSDIFMLLYSSEEHTEWKE